jgi:hypothetical protein
VIVTNVCYDFCEIYNVNLMKFSSCAPKKFVIAILEENEKTKKRKKEREMR